MARVEGLGLKLCSRYHSSDDREEKDEDEEKEADEEALMTFIFTVMKDSLFFFFHLFMTHMELKLRN